jgi:Spy/CpxP family protein refolding chaperone
MMEPCPPALLARILDLSDDQKKQISAVLKNAREDAVPLLKKREENFRQLRKVEGTPVFDEKTVSAVARSIGGIEAEMIVSRAKTHARIRELLTPAQRELVSRIEPWIFGPPLPPPCGKPR